MIEEKELLELRALKEKHDKGQLIEMILDFQNNIETPPITAEAMYSQSSSSDSATTNHWEKIWLENVEANHKKYGPFKDRGIGKFFNAHKYKPCIIAGSGPSLKKNGHLLKDRGEIPLVSCLHNFHYFEDQDIHVDFYMSLDAGPVTVEEVYEGGSHDPEWYWERSKGKILIAFIGTHPSLLEKWQGEVYFMNSPVPSKDYMEKLNAIEPFFQYISTGGNVLGACLYFAKGYLGCNPIAFVGADFCFSYMRRFHAWNSKYDANLGNVVKMIDVYGNKVLSWQSYANFKAWFDSLALRVPGIWLNCTEGGTLGAFAEGNMIAIKQMKLAGFLDMYHMSRHLEAQALDPTKPDMKILF